MMKFFRKHNKKLLAIFMSLLMVVFIGGSALEWMLVPDPSYDVAYSKYGKITNSGLLAKKNQVTDILMLTGRDWSRPFSTAAQPLELMDWYLLVKEAEALGLGANVAEVRGSAAGAFDQIADLARRLRIRPDVVHQAMAEYRAVQNSALAIGAAAYPSEAEVQKAARDALEKVSIKAVVIPAEPFAKFQDEPSEEELHAHFEKYRDKERGEGLTFGYYRHPSARVQYVKIERDAIAESIGVANLERKAKAYYEENKETHMPFRRHAGNMPEPPTAEGENADAETSPYLTWEEAKPIAIAVVKKQQASKAAGELAQWIVDYASEGWLEAERSESGYKQAPESARKEDYFAKILEHVPATHQFPSAVSVETTDPFMVDEAHEVPELGMARFDPASGAMFSFGRLVAKSEAFIPALPKDVGAADSDYLAVFQASPRPMQDPRSGNHFVFRVVEAAPGRPADSLDEVREELIADVKLLHAFDAAKRRAESLADCAVGSSLKEAFESDKELAEAGTVTTAAGYFEPQPFARVPQALASEGRPASGIYVGAGVGRLPNDAVDQIFAVAESGESAAVVELPDRAAVLYVEVTGLARAEEDEFNATKKQLGQQMAEARWRRAVTDWLDPEQIRARSGLTFPNAN